MTLAFENHDHNRLCRKVNLSRIEEICQKNGLRLTQSRYDVLTILLGSHNAIGAYDILSQLTEAGMRAQPPIVYRALEFLCANGFAHKIQSLNAYVACMHPGEQHRPTFLICRNCTTVGETQADGLRIDSGDFVIENEVIEAEGLCKSCQKI